MECDLDFVLSAVPSSGTGLWTMVSGPGIASFNDSVSPNDSVIVSIYGTYVFMWTETNGTCSDFASISVAFSEPPISNGGTGGAVCDLNFGFNATTSVGAGTWTQVSGPGLTAFNNANNPSTSGTITSFGTYVYQWTEVNGTCSDSDTISVIFNDQPVADAGIGGIECDLDFNLSANPSVGSGIGRNNLALEPVPIPIQIMLQLLLWLTLLEVMFIAGQKQMEIVQTFRM
jgi:hypothetical protein